MASRDFDQQEALPFHLVNNQEDSASPVFLCSNNCGFFASPNTNNLCSVCYQKSQQTHDAAAVSNVAENVDLGERPADCWRLFRASGTRVNGISTRSETQQVFSSPALPAEAFSPSNADAVNGDEFEVVPVCIRFRRNSSPVKDFRDLFTSALPETQVSPSPLRVISIETSSFPDPARWASFSPFAVPRASISPVPAPSASSLPVPELKLSCASGSEAKPSNRCHICRKRLCLGAIFKCRCGDSVFCSAHRFPDQHACTFDMKAVDRERIMKANPVIKADKLHDRI